MRYHNFLKIILTMLAAFVISISNAFAASSGCESLINTLWIAAPTLNAVWENGPPIVVPFIMNVTTVQKKKVQGDVIEYILDGNINGQLLNGSCYQRISDGDVTWVQFDGEFPNKNPSISILSRDIMGPVFTTLDIPNNGIYFQYNGITYTNDNDVTLAKK